eukprot:scaffold1618_cov196-Alexandrium_tamarense.AAC.28
MANEVHNGEATHAVSSTARVIASRRCRTYYWARGRLGRLENAVERFRESGVDSADSRFWNWTKSGRARIAEPSLQPLSNFACQERAIPSSSESVLCRAMTELPPLLSNNTVLTNPESIELHSIH